MTAKANPRGVTRETMDILRKINLGGSSFDAIVAGVLASLVTGLALDSSYRDELIRLASADISGDNGYGLTESGQGAIKELLDVVDPGWRGMREEYDFAGASRGLFCRGGSGDVSADALRDLVSEVCAWAQLNRFDDDQDPALDSPAQRAVRALDRWQAVSAGSPVGDRAESRIRVLELGLAEAIEWCETLVGESLSVHHPAGEAIDRLTALLDDE